MSVRGDFAKLERIRQKLAKVPQLAPLVAQRAAAGSSNFKAEGAAVQITVSSAGGKPRKRKRAFWGHGFKLNMGFLPPQWMQRVKRAADAVLESTMGGR